MGCENNCVNEHRLKKIEEDFKEFRNKTFIRSLDRSV